MLKKGNPIQWNSLKVMMDHNEEREKDPHWEVCQHNIVNFLLDVCNLDFTAEEINHVIGVIEVNAFEVSLGPSGQTGRGVFPLLAKLNHGCVSNCRYINVEEGRVMECRATVVVRAGEEVRDHYVSPLQSTVRRREGLKVGWYFSCECERCGDSSESGTDLSSFSCSGLREREDRWGTSSPCPGVVRAVNSLQADTDYHCHNCPNIFSSNLVTGLREEVEEMLAMTDKSDVMGLEFLLEMYGKSLHRSNSTVLTIKRHLIYIYGRSAEYCDEERLAKKIEFCEDILSACDVLMPGLTKERGLTLYELIMATVQAQVKQPEDLLDLLKEAEKCLQFERKGTFEFVILSKVRLMLQYLDV